MHLSLNEQQTLIEDSAQAFLAAEHGPAQRGYGSAGDALAPRLWPAFAEMGWLGLPLPESAGGFGGGAMDTGLLMRAFGRHGVNAPFHGNVLLAARLLAALGSAPQQAQWLPAIMAGERRVAFAHDESHTGDPWAPRQTCAMRVGDGDGWLLHGAKILAVGAPGADALLVSARLPEPAQATGLFVVPLPSPGLRLASCSMADGALAADVRMDGVRVGNDGLLDVADAGPALERVLAEGLIALCWEACGAMQAALELTVAHTRQREQFGRPLSSFQVVQHRLAEMAVCCEEAQAACELAALRIDGGADDVPAAASMARSKVGRAARFVAQEAVQLHGAMGVSEELPVAALFRKLTQFQQLGGATAWHGARLGERLLATGGWRNSQTLLSPRSLATDKPQAAAA